MEQASRNEIVIQLAEDRRDGNIAVTFPFSPVPLSVSSAQTCVFCYPWRELVPHSTCQAARHLHTACLYCAQHISASDTVMLPPWCLDLFALSKWVWIPQERVEHMKLLPAELRRWDKQEKAWLCPAHALEEIKTHWRQQGIKIKIMGAEVSTIGFTS